MKIRLAYRICALFSYDHRIRRLLLSSYNKIAISVSQADLIEFLLPGQDLITFGGDRYGVFEMS